eukprot:gene11689-biopygen3218
MRRVFATAIELESKLSIPREGIGIERKKENEKEEDERMGSKKRWCGGIKQQREGISSFDSSSIRSRTPSS